VDQGGDGLALAVQLRHGAQAVRWQQHRSAERIDVLAATRNPERDLEGAVSQRARKRLAEPVLRRSLELEDEVAYAGVGEPRTK